MKDKNVRLKAIEKIIQSRKKDGCNIQIVKIGTTLDSNIGCFDNVPEEFISKMIVKYNN